MNQKKDLLFSFLDKECQRQAHGINLIASENYASPEILSMVGSCLMNKYVEGNVKNRYYSGFEYIDLIEQETIDRFKTLFGAEHVNVQPHSGTQANQAVYFSCLKPGDTVLSMNLTDGGHLSHGHPATLVGSIYNIVSYGVDKTTEQIDYNEVERLALLHKPKLIIAGASAYSRTIDFEKFSIIAKKVGALFLADIAHIAGLVAAKLHPSPVAYADFVTMTTQKTFRGPRGGIVFCKKEFAQKIDKAVMPGLQGGTCMNIVAAKGVACQEAMNPSYKDYQLQVIKNAQTMAQEFKNLGYKVISDGTDNHMFLIDVSHLGITGKQAEELLEQHAIFVNRNLIPFDTKSALQCSGIRIGTAAITTKKALQKESLAIVHCIDRILRKIDLDTMKAQIQEIIDNLS